MQGHKGRLIESGLLSPLSPEETVKRMGILLRVENGAKIPAEEVPNYVVFRADKPFTHVSLAANKRCEDAELIADHLYYYEAYRLCRELASKDPEQPERALKHLPKFEMYKICSHKEWGSWVTDKSQISIFDSEERE